MLKAVTRQAANVDAKIRALNAEAEAQGKRQAISTANFFDHHATPDDIAVMVTEDDFAAAHRELIPSVSAGELSHYERVRASFEGGRDGAGGAGTQEWPGQARSTVSTALQQSAKGKGKVVIGKGKAVAGAGAGAAASGSDADEAEYQDDYGVKADEDEGADGASRDKGKGKAVAGFQNGTASDDEGLYD